MGFTVELCRPRWLSDLGARTLPGHKGRGPVACVILACSQGNVAGTGRVIVGLLTWATALPQCQRQRSPGVGGRDRTALGLGQPSQQVLGQQQSTYVPGLPFLSRWS